MVEKAPDINSLREIATKRYNFDAETSFNQLGSLSAEATEYLTYQLIASSLPPQLVEALEDDDFDHIVVDEKIDGRLLEKNLDSAVKYLQACVSLRNDYAALAKLHLDTELKNREFLVLDAIHQREVDNGLYQLPYIEAFNDAVAYRTSSGNAHTQYYDVATEVLKRRQDLVTEYSSNGWAISSYASPPTSALNPSVTPALFKQAVTELAQSNIDIMEFTWQYNQAAAGMLLAQYDGKANTAEAKRDYLKKDVDFRTARRIASKQLAYTQIIENSSPDSIQNYAIRLNNTKELFKLTLRKLVSRVKSLSNNLEDIYGMNSSIEPGVQAGNIVNYCAEWLLNVQDDFNKKKVAERVSVHSFSIKRAAGSDWDNIHDPNGSSFELSNTQLGDSKKLLRGIAFEYLTSGSGTLPVSLRVQRPGATQATAAPEILSFGRVLPVGKTGDLRPQFSDQLWNRRANGTWKIRALLPEFQEAPVDELYMYLWTAELT